MCSCDLIESEMETFVADAQDNRYSLTWKEFKEKCLFLAGKIDWNKYDSIFPVIRGGVYPAIELSEWSGLPIVWKAGENSLVVDEICDSGATLEIYRKVGLDTAVLHYKGRCEAPTYYVEQTDKWIVYPWESSKDIEATVRRQIEYFGDNPNRSGIEETPKRVVKSWHELYAGYNQDPKEILAKRFEVERKESAESPVVLRDIEFFSTCEHHLLPFFGTVTVGYIPGNEVVGISKLARLVECFSRRLQIQERMCEQIADAIQSELNPRGVYVRAKAKHLCMVARGIQKQNAVMDSIAVRGEYDAIEKLI